MLRLRLTLPLGLLSLVLPFTARAADYYVATTGSGTTCSMAAPCGRVEDAQTRAVAGDTVWIRGGTYTFATSATVGVAFSKSGGNNNPIHYFAYANEIPVFDLSNGNPGGRVTGLSITGSWIHIRGLEVRGVQQFMSGQDSWGVRIQGSNNLVERVVSHHNEAPGFFITSGANNRILNCDSHHNYDQLEGGGSGDGFGCHSSGGGNVLSGCRAYNNSDDGYDFINASGTCTVEKSWAWSNGYVPDTTTAAGNGAGFKAGGFGSPPTNVPNPVPRHAVRQCIAFGNRAQGFYANHHPGGIDFYNNVGFRNPTNYNMLADNGFPSAHTLRNNIAMASGTAISNLTGGTDTFNSWSLSVTVSNADFLSVTESEAGSPRQADGSLPNVNFMHLATNSDLIDKGTNVGLPFSGTAPDLGPFETGLVGGMGGMGGMAGAAGMGGSGNVSGAGGTGGRAGNGGAGNGGAGNGGRAGNAGMAGTGNAGAGAGGRAGAGGAAGAGNAGGAGNGAGGIAGAGNTSGMAGAGNTGGVAGAGNTGGMAGAGTAGMSGAGNAAGASMGGMSGGGDGGVGGTIVPGGSGGMSAGGASAGVGNEAGVGGTLAPGGAAGVPATGGTTTATGGASATGGTGTAGTGATSGEPPAGSDVAGEDGGCTCRTVGPRPNGGLSALAFLSLVTAGAWRRRSRRS